MEQLITPNYDIAYTGGYCERFIENTTGQSGVFASATDAWNAGNANHPGELPPSGVRVAVYFALGSTPAGHVALSLEDGRVASSTQEGYHTTAYIHPNLQNLISMYSLYNNGCTYLGWSEYIGKIKVVGENMSILTREEIIVEYQLVTLGQNPPEDHIAAWTGRNLDDYLQYLQADPSIQGLQNSYKASTDQVTTLQGQLNDANQKIAELENTPEPQPVDGNNTPVPTPTEPVTSDQTPITSVQPKTGFWSALKQLLKGFF